MKRTTKLGCCRRSVGLHDQCPLLFSISAQLDPHTPCIELRIVLHRHRRVYLTHDGTTWTVLPRQNFLKLLQQAILPLQ